MLRTQLGSRCFTACVMVGNLKTQLPRGKAVQKTTPGVGGETVCLKLLPLF